MIIDHLEKILECCIRNDDYRLASAEALQVSKKIRSQLQDPGLFFLYEKLETRLWTMKINTVYFHFINKS